MNSSNILEIYENTRGWTENSRMSYLDNELQGENSDLQHSKEGERGYSGTRLMILLRSREYT